MTKRQAIRYFNREARYYERGPYGSGPFYAVRVPGRCIALHDKDVAKLADKFYTAVGVKAAREGED